MKTKALDYLINRFCLDRENTRFYYLPIVSEDSGTLWITDGVTGIRIFKKNVSTIDYRDVYKFFVIVVNLVQDTYIQYRLSELLKRDNINALTPEDFRFS